MLLATASALSFSKPVPVKSPDGSNIGSSVQLRIHQVLPMGFRFGH